MAPGSVENLRDMPPNDRSFADPAVAVSGRVLVVDDDPDSAETLAELVRLWKYDARVSLDGSSALREARAFRPDIILLDIGLPGQDGYQVARQLRKEGLVGALLIALTGYGQDEDRRRAEEAGFDRHLTKPVSPDLLQKVLTRR